MDRHDSGSRIVVGVDGSPSSHAALRWAVRYAGLVGASVDAVAAWDLPGARSWSAPAVDTAFDEEQAERGLVEEVRGVLGQSGASQVHERLVRGDPAEVLLDAAEGAEALVVGSRGRGGFRRALLGSVSHQCAIHATCPVVIVRPETDAGKGDEPRTS
ncbi:universal stress protein [Streptomyces wuyuanensis]|uniref:Nucleotide-binding universal stress protein, UspA family n=1 Tax=Streptomyces wuyuanensis TaxID=1196353 RepID=A0A1G9YGV0_9ACTN|nr:universal stress protein [Streptomyces wuyuanensis]SDN07776.1 Nucleotide-binding universal stress protein, UspA family [Streptomyces wuyuanensis]